VVDRAKIGRRRGDARLVQHVDPDCAATLQVLGQLLGRGQVACSDDHLGAGAVRRTGNLRAEASRTANYENPLAG